MHGSMIARRRPVKDVAAARLSTPLVPCGTPIAELSGPPASCLLPHAAAEPQQPGLARLERVGHLAADGQRLALVRLGEDLGLQAALGAALDVFQARGQVVDDR